MKASELKGWSRNQLSSRSARLNGRIDGLVSYRRTLWEELQETVEKISSLEELRRLADIGFDQDSLDHLRQREMHLRDEVKDLGVHINNLDKELEMVDHELSGRSLSKDIDQQMEASRRRTDKEMKRLRNRHMGWFGRIKSWFFGRY